MSEHELTETFLTADPAYLAYLLDYQADLDELRDALMRTLLDNTEMTDDEIEQAVNIGGIDERLTTELFLAVADFLPDLTLADEVIVQQPDGVDCTEWSITIRPPEDTQTVAALRPLTKRLAFVFSNISYEPDAVITVIDYPYEMYEGDDGEMYSRLNTDDPEIQVLYQKHCVGAPQTRSDEAEVITVQD